MTFFLYQLGAFFAWVVYGSFFEWWFHKYLFHSPKLIHATFHAHAIVHHQLYKGDNTYDTPSPQDPEGKHIMMDWFALPIFILTHLPLLLFGQWVTGIPSVWGGVAAIAFYYAGYETLHYFMHVPRNRWIERTRVFRFLKEHHRLHHKYMQKNLNVFIPLADLVLRTLRTHEGPAPALKLVTDVAPALKRRRAKRTQA